MMRLSASTAHARWRLFVRHAMYKMGAPACLLLLFSAFGWMPAASAQTTPETVGRLSGDDVAVAGALSFDEQNGRSTAILASGSEVTVRSGQARIELVEGGEVAICGPAHFTVFKAGGAITLALDYGRVHPMLDAAVPFAVYTPFVVATPIAIDQGPRDLTVGLDQQGALCAVPAHGATRIEQQLTGQSLLVPQGGEVNLADGQLSAKPATRESCKCDLLVSRDTTPKQLELSVPVKPEARRPGEVPPPVLTDQPVYMVYMPPLAFDANSLVPPPDPDPKTIVLVRESVLRPEVVFRGHVEASAKRSAAQSSGAAGAAARASGGPQSNNSSSGSPGLFAKIYRLFRRHKERAAGTP